MHVTKLSLKNHKCYFDKTEFSFSKGFNVILGANNSGKTATAQALIPWTVPVPHQSDVAPPFEQAPFDAYGKNHCRI